MQTWLWELSVNLDKDFVTPDWTKVIEWYPEYRARELKAGKRILEFGDYINEVIRALVSLDCRPGRTKEQWLKRFYEHFGINYLMAMWKRFEFDPEDWDKVIVFWDVDEIV